MANGHARPATVRDQARHTRLWLVMTLSVGWRPHASEPQRPILGMESSDAVEEGQRAERKKGMQAGRKGMTGARSFFFLVQPAETGGGDKPTMRHGVAMPISSRTIPLYPTAGPRVHASTGSRSRRGRVGGGKGEETRSRLNFRSQSYPRVPRPYSQGPRLRTQSRRDPHPEARRWAMHGRRPRGRGEARIHRTGPPDMRGRATPARRRGKKGAPTG